MSRFKSLISKILLLVIVLPAVGRMQPGASQGLQAPAAVIFTNSLQSLGGETGNAVALGDLDGDGDADAFVANDYSPPEANQIWLNQGDGAFSAGQTLGAADGTSVALGDLDGDGDRDAVVTTLAPLSANVWLNQGGDQGGSPGTFAAGASLGSASGYAVALGDVDNDSDLDALIVGNSNQVFLNNGDATFAPGPALPFLFSRAATLVDLDGDGFRDAVIADSASGTDSRVWWNDANWTPGPGTFTQGQLLPAASLVNAAAAGDLDGDERPDIFFASSGQDLVFWNQGGRNFTPGAPLAPSDNSYAVVLGDVELDGDLDAVVGNITADPNRVWENLGGRTFTVTQEFGDETGLYWTRGLGLADLNGDGAFDLFDVTTAEDRVWLNAGEAPPTPGQEGWQRQAVDTRGDAGRSLSMALDANGYPHISYVTRVAYDYDASQGYFYDYYLRYAFWDGVRWHEGNISSFAAIHETVLRLDTNGYPHIAFNGPQRLGYVRWNGSRWQETYVPIFSDHNFDFTLDSNNNPHFLTWAGLIVGDLIYMHLENSTWISDTVASGVGSYDVSLELDGDDNPHVTYFDDGSEELIYAAQATGWQAEVVRSNVHGVFGFASLALDNSGVPSIAYSAWGAGTPAEMTYARRVGNTWQSEIADTPILGADFENVSLALDSVGEPHLFYTLLDDYTNTGTFFRYAHRQGTAWQRLTLDHSGNLDFDQITPVSAALDADDQLHAAYRDPSYGDLRFISWDQNWQVRPLPEAGSIRSTALEVETTTPALAYYNQSGGQVKLADWGSAWDVTPLDFVANPVDDLSVGAAYSNRGVSYYDADNQRLMYRYWNGSVWNAEVVDEAGDVGRYNNLLLMGDANSGARIAYWDATTRRIKLARPRPDSVLWDIFPNLAGPALDADSGALSAAVLPGGDIGVAYYDAANGDLRLGSWDHLSGAWSDELVDGAGDAGSLSSLRTDSSEGTPVVAYLGPGAIRIAYKLGGLWQSQDVPNTAGEAVTSLSLELGLNSRRHARIAYTTAAGALRVASLRNGVWRIEEVAPAAEGAGAASSAQDARLHLAYSRLAGGLSYAFRSATLDIDLTSPSDPPPAFFGDGYYNPLDACQALLDMFAPESRLHSASSHFTALAAPTPPAGSLGDDHRVFNAMTALFVATPGGQHYVDLYRQHGAEMGQIGLQDPALLWDSYGVLQNFIPGIAALVTGQGDRLIVTQAMVDDALDIWQRLAAAGSPALAATINAELAAYNNLQDFAGMSFDEWARAIGVEPPQVIRLPLVGR